MRTFPAALALATVAAVAGCADVDIERIGWPPHEPRPEGSPVTLFVADYAPEAVHGTYGSLARAESDLPRDAHGIAHVAISESVFLSRAAVVSALEEAARATGGDAVLLTGSVRRLIVGDRVLGAVYRVESRPPDPSITPPTSR